MCNPLVLYVKITAVIQMKIIEKNNSVIIHDINDFNPTHTFMCGQCFRWDEENDGSYTGVAFSKPVNISFVGGCLTIKNITLSEFNSQWKDYLDLDTDYNLIKSHLSSDENVKTAMDFGWGIKILNQEIFECLISFIISTQNAIPRIKKIVSKLSEMYGKKLSYCGKTYYAFPELSSLSGITEEELAPLKAGYRAGYIVDAVKKIESGQVQLENLKSMPYSDAKKELMKIKGVGPKVADCVLLFSCHKKEAFPIDVWVKRTVQTLYLDENAKEKEISAFAAEHFGEFAGIAQQYLFYYARENKLGQ